MTAPGSGATGLPVLLRDGCAALGVAIGAEQAGLLLRYLQLVLEANEEFNLTSVAEPVAAVERHLIDTLSVLRVLDAETRVSPLVDIGTGAGLPGLPLACARPGWRLTLVDATRKKVRFVERTARSLGLTRVATEHARAEAFGRDPTAREAFAAGVARAVAPLNVLVELALPLVRLGGCFVAMKGPEGEREAAAAAPAIDLLGGVVERVDAFSLPFTDAGRRLVVIRKIAGSPTRFPRRAGIPNKRPLG